MKIKYFLPTISLLCFLFLTIQPVQARKPAVEDFVGIEPFHKTQGRKPSSEDMQRGEYTDFSRVKKNSQKKEVFFSKLANPKRKENIGYILFFLVILPLTLKFIVSYGLNRKKKDQHDLVGDNHSTVDYDDDLPKAS